MMKEETRSPGQNICSPHKERRLTLEALAIMCGFTRDVGPQLPDGKRPDVLMLREEEDALFLGDAKHTEPPGCTETRTRLLNYMRWFAVQVLSRQGDGVFAICFENPDHADGWVDTLNLLAYEAGFENAQFKVGDLGGRHYLVWWYTSRFVNTLEITKEACSIQT